MPAKDGSGPLGLGARTGRGKGKCQPAFDIKNQVAEIPQIIKRPYFKRSRKWSNILGYLFGRNRVNKK